MLFGNPSHYVLNPKLLTSFYGDLNFKKRVISTVFDLYISLYQMYRFYDRKHITLSKYFNIKSTARQLTSDTDMLFVNVNPILYQSPLEDTKETLPSYFYQRLVFLIYNQLKIDMYRVVK